MSKSNHKSQKTSKLTISMAHLLERSKISTDISEHLVHLYELTIALPENKIVVELGTRGGESTTALLAAVNDSGGKLYSIDIQNCNIYPHEANWKFIQGDDMEIVKTWNLKIDHLFIDTLHTYEHTLAELRSWGKFVQPWGIITLHDTNHTHSYPGVTDAIKQFLVEHPEYSFKNRQECHGLGLLHHNNK